jgi:hypothetical protein
MYDFLLWWCCVDKLSDDQIGSYNVQVSLKVHNIQREILRVDECRLFVNECHNDYLDLVVNEENRPENFEIANDLSG